MSFRNPRVEFGVRSLAAAAVICAAAGVATAQEAGTPPAAAPAPAAPATAPAAGAPGAPAAAASPWLKVCNNDPKSGTPVCVVTQELRAETGQPIAAVTIQNTKEPGKYGFGIVVPIGFILPPGITLTVDGQKKATAEFKICLPGQQQQQQPAACIAQAVVAEDFIASLKKGNELGLVVVNAQNKPLGLKMSLTGFSKTFDGPGVDRAAAEAQRQQLSEALQKSAEEARKKLIEQQQKELGNPPQ